MRLVVTTVIFILTNFISTRSLSSADVVTPEQSPSQPAGQLCLTFDDAPNGEGAIFTGEERTQQLIDRLDALGIPEVAFFCVTERLCYHSGNRRLRQYAAAGHLIANHTHSHPAPETDGARSYIRDFLQAHDSLTQFTTFTPWFRYPLLHEGKTIPVRDSIRRALASMGYRNGYVTIDTWDFYLDRRWRDAASEGLVTDTVALGKIYVETLWGAIQFYDRMANDVLGSSPGHVLLLHENDLAALFIDDLVIHLREHDWEIITPTEAYQDPLADYIPDVLYNNQGRIAAIAVDRDYEGPLRHPSEGAEYLDSLLQARRVFTKP